MLVVEGEVARAFIEHAGLGARLRLLAQGLTNARELDRIIGVRVREGAATRVESGLQRIEVRRIEAEISRLEEAQARTRNGLAVLVGDEAPSFVMPATRWESFVPPRSPRSSPRCCSFAGLTSAPTRRGSPPRRVMSSRRAPPFFRRSASRWERSSKLGRSVSRYPPSRDWSRPIFDGGRRRGQLDAATGAQLETVEQYRRGLLVALGEAENALAGVAQSTGAQRS
jgi:outer membrane protein TolC